MSNRLSFQTKANPVYGGECHQRNPVSTWRRIYLEPRCIKTSVYTKFYLGGGMNALEQQLLRAELQAEGEG